jgi:hypothetical protein
MTSALRVPGGALGLALAVGLGLVAYHFLAGSRHAASAAPAARAHPATHHHASHGTLAPETTPAPKMTVASAASAGGRVRLRLATPAHGRYVLIWFTRLPPDPAGTFQPELGREPGGTWPPAQLTAKRPVRNPAAGQCR